MKVSTPLAAVAFATVAIAKNEDYGRLIRNGAEATTGPLVGLESPSTTSATGLCEHQMYLSIPQPQNKQQISARHYTVHHVMPQFVNPFQRNSKVTDTRSSHGRQSSACSSLGSTVQPGKVVSKAERQRRRTERADSAFANLDGQADEKLNYEVEHNWTAFKAKVAADIRISDYLKTLDQQIEENFAPGACAAHVPELQTRRGRCSFRSLIVLIICFLLVFGALYNLIDYLLFMTRASACSVSTVYLPITYTVTSGMPLVSPVSGSNDTIPLVTSTSTTTQTTTVLETETVTSFLSTKPEITSTMSQTADSEPSYAYYTNSAGSTVWINGHSPSSNAILATITQTITVQPVPADDPSLSIVKDTQTITPPAYTSTVYSYVGPDITSTSTSTHYVTRTVSLVSRPPTITTTRTSFQGINSGGWNASSLSDPAGAAETSDPESTTITVVSYFGSGTETTSTKTMFITTTVAVAYTTTLYPEIVSPVGTGYVTTITALPVTITPVASGPLFSTSIPLLNASSSSTTPSAAVVGPHHTTLSSVSASPATSPASSGVFSNSTHSAAPTGHHGPIISTTLTSGPEYSPVASKPSSSASGSSHRSITDTISAAALSNTQSVSTLPPLSNTPQASSSGKLNTTAAITRTLSTLGSSTSSTLRTSTTKSVVPHVSPHTGGSTTSSHLINSTTSSAVYGYPPNPGPSTSLSLANSFTSVSSTSVSRRPHHSPPSTLATSTRSPATFNSSSTSPSHSTASPNSPTQLSSTATTSSRARPKVSQSKRSSLAPNVTTTLSTTTSASNPFPPSSATATPTGGCGEHGPFMVNFDDFPRFLPNNPNNTSITQAPPIPNPYHHLTFSNGYVYAPEPSEPYQPVSQPHLAVFLANGTGKTASPFGNLVKPGEIGDGPRDSISAFWFNARSAYFGCDNPGPGPCTLVLSAYTWSQAANEETISYVQNVTIPACPSLTSMNCQLHKIDFPPTFQSLSGLQIQAFTGNDQRMFFMDNLALAWTNNTCAAGLLRQSSQ